MTCPHALPRMQPARHAMTAPHLCALRAQSLETVSSTTSHTRSPHLSTALPTFRVPTRARQMICHERLLYAALVPTPTVPLALCNWKHLCLLLSPR
jgi:hypothetical protein